MNTSEYRKIYRICDANLNRTKEGLRVVEDYLRFYKEDEPLMRKVRGIRHSLAKLVDHELYEKFIKERDILKDCGMNIKENERETIKNLVIANIKRAEEGLRVLEEYSKIIFKDKSALLKTLRYKVYNLEKKFFE